MKAVDSENSKEADPFYAFVNAIFFIPGHRRAVKVFSKSTRYSPVGTGQILATFLRAHPEFAIADRHGGPDGRRLFQPGGTMPQGGLKLEG